MLGSERLGFHVLPRDNEEKLTSFATIIMIRMYSPRLREGYGYRCSLDRTEKFILPGSLYIGRTP
jgi:hypothetical protein